MQVILVVFTTPHCCTVLSVEFVNSYDLQQKSVVLYYQSLDVNVEELRAQANASMPASQIQN